MKRFWTDGIAIGTVLVGIILMALTIAWRINPAEGSVVPRFLTGNPVGVAVIGILLVTCMPAWIVSVLLASLTPVPYRIQYVLACIARLAIQGLLWFMIGRLISVCVPRLKRKKQTIEPAGAGDA